MSLTTWPRRLCVAACVAGLSACSPALNWRTVLAHQLTVWLPCKPDQAQRTVQIGKLEPMLTVWACEAGGAMYAVSHLQVDPQVDREQVVSAWRTAALRNLHGATDQTQSFGVTASMGTAAGPPAMVSAEGRGPTGQATQAQWLWLTFGQEVYQLAVYAPKITPAMTEQFFSEIRHP